MADDYSMGPTVPALFKAHEDRYQELLSRYTELLYAVGNRYPGETRHETALRYIRQAEAPRGDRTSARQGSEHG